MKTRLLDEKRKSVCSIEWTKGCVLTCRWCRYFCMPRQQPGQSRNIQHVYFLVRTGDVERIGLTAR